MWAVVQPDFAVVGVLSRAYRRAARHRLAEVTTDLVLYQAAFYLDMPQRPLPFAVDRAWRRVRRGRAGLTDPPYRPPIVDAGIDAEAEAAAGVALRLAASSGAKHLPRRVRGHRLPEFSPMVRRAVYQAFHDARRAGLERASVAHLAVALLELSGSAAQQLVSGWPGWSPEARAAELRRHTLYRTGPAPDKATTVQEMQVFGVLPLRVRRGRRTALAAFRVFHWLTVRSLRRRYRRHGAFWGHPMLVLVLTAARGWAVRLGRPYITGAEVLLGILGRAEDLDAAGEELPSHLARYNQGGRILRAHGVRLEAAVRAAAELVVLPADAEDDLSGVPRTGWEEPTTPPNEPPWGRTALLALRSASHTARGLAHPYAGTTVLLARLLDEPDGPAARLLHALEVDPAAVRAEAVRHAGGSG